MRTRNGRPFYQNIQQRKSKRTGEIFKRKGLEVDRDKGVLYISFITVYIQGTSQTYILAAAKFYVTN